MLLVGLPFNLTNTSSSPTVKLCKGERERGVLASVWLVTVVSHAQPWTREMLPSDVFHLITLNCEKGKISSLNGCTLTHVGLLEKMGTLSLDKKVE